MANYFDDTTMARPEPGRSPFRLSLVLGALILMAAALSGMDGGTSRRAAEPPSPLKFGEVRLPGGVRLHYAEQGEPDGEPVILLHGYSDSWFSWSRVLPLFPASWRVYALDQRGHGESDRPLSGYAMRDLGADVLAFMDAKDIRRATIVGHSLGGLVAQQVAAQAARRVERLVIVASGADVKGVNGVAELEQAVMALPEPVPQEFIREFQASTIYVPTPPEFFERVVAESSRLPARVWHALMAGMVNEPPAELSAARFPTLLLWGEEDAVFPRATQDDLQARIPGARLIVYPETGHAVHWERPEQFAEDLRDFMGVARRREGTR